METVSRTGEETITAKRQSTARSPQLETLCEREREAHSMARQLSSRAWHWITVIGLLALFFGWWYWRDSRSDVLLHPGGKATFYRAGFFHRDVFELTNYGGKWRYFRREPLAVKDLFVPFECKYNDYYTLLLEEGGRAYVVDKKKESRSELRIVNGEWSMGAGDHWQSIFDEEIQLDLENSR